VRLARCSVPETKGSRSMGVLVERRMVRARSG